MNRERNGATGLPGEAGDPEERSRLHGAAAGVVAGLGAFFVFRHLDGGGLAGASLYDVPFLLLSAAMLYAGFWLLRYDADHRRVSHIALCSLVGFLVLVAVGVWASGGRAEGVQSAARFAVDVGTVGASSGLLVGLEGERRRRKVDRDAAVAVDRAEDRLAFFNRLLRHHLLNGVAVVRGHAELLTEAYDDPPEPVDVICHRCDELVDLVRSVETLSRAFTGDLEVETVEPRVPLVNAVERARAGGASVEVAGDLGDRLDGRRVVANERIGLVFEAVLDVSLDAAGGGPVTVSTAERTDEFVVTFAIDGSFPAGPDAAVQPGEYGDEELELFVAETLLEYFGGALELPSGGPGSTLALRLPLVD